MPKSIEMNPPNEGGFTLFLESQFRTQARWPPKNTDLQGQVGIITGSTAGLGLEASRQLLSFGLSTLILAVRNTTKGEQIASKLRADYPESDIQIWHLEMESYESIQTFARRVDAELSRLDMVILNAGVQVVKFTKILSTRHEKSIQVNYLSTMLLAILLLPILKTKSPTEKPGRLSIVNSGTARGATLPYQPGRPLLSSFDDTKLVPWNPVSRYAVSKLLAHLFIINLVQYVNADDVVVNLVDPGLVKNTNLQGEVTGFVGGLFWLMKAALARSLPMGASTYVDAVILKGKESHGCFVNNWMVKPFAAYAYTSEGIKAREQLWNDTMVEFEPFGVRKILEDLRK